jgi:hypothetical protein
MVVAGNELQELPYGPGGHPDPLGASEEDCSSTVNYVLYRAACARSRKSSKTTPGPGLRQLGGAGPGSVGDDLRADSPTPHVFIVIAGLRLDTSHNGTDVGPEPKTKTARAGGSSTTSRPGRTGRSVTRRGCKVPAMAARKVDYLLIGGGLASANCARWLREEGARGRCCWWAASPTRRTTARSARRAICGARRPARSRCSARRVVVRAEHRAADAHERDGARPDRRARPSCRARRRSSSTRR